MAAHTCLLRLCCYGDAHWAMTRSVISDDMELVACIRA